VDNTDTTGGIFIPMFVSGLVFTLKNLIIKDNLIDSPFKGGVRLELGNGGAGSLLSGCKIADNTIKNVGQLASANGVELVSVPKFFACSVERNKVIDDRTVNKTASVVTYFNAASDDGVNNLQLIDNELSIADTSFLSSINASNYYNIAACFLKAKVRNNGASIGLAAALGSIIEDPTSGRLYKKNSVQWNSVEYGTAAPTTGIHQIGDICYNAGSASPNGWRCTVAGLPGTFASI
jgi:hypothetical protein